MPSMRSRSPSTHPPATTTPFRFTVGLMETATETLKWKPKLKQTQEFGIGAQFGVSTSATTFG